MPVAIYDCGGYTNHLNLLQTNQCTARKGDECSSSKDCMLCTSDGIKDSFCLSNDDWNLVKDSGSIQCT